jgi:hypothetical protein
MATSKDVIKSFTIKVNTENGKVKVEGLTKSFIDARKASEQLNGELRKMSGKKGGLGAFDKASGSAAASVTEMGRVISDMPYGIRGVANNLSQLASQLANSYRNAGSFKNVMADLRMALVGPLGVLLAIQTVISLLDAFGGSLFSASKKVDDFREAAAQGGSDLRLLLNQVERGNISNEDLAKSVNKANLEYKDLNITLDDNGKLTKESTQAIKDKIKALEELAFANALLVEVEKRQAKVIETTLDARKQFDDDTLTQVRRMIEEDEAALAKHLEAGGLRETFFGQLDDADTSSTEFLAAPMVRAIMRAEEEVNELSDVFGDDGIVNKVFNGKESGGSGGNGPKVFKKQVLDLKKFILQQQKELIEAGQKNEVRRLEIQEEYLLQDIDRQFETFKEKQAMRLKDFMAKARNDKEREEAQRKHDESIKEAMIEAGEAKLAITENYAKRITLKEQEIRQKIFTIEADSFMKLMQSQRQGLDPEALMTDEFLRVEDSARGQKLAQLTEAQRLAEEGGNETEITKARQNLMQFEEELRQQDIQNELDYFNAKKNVQLEYVGFLNQTSQFLQTIAGENEALQKAGIIAEKSAATAEVVINAQKSIAARVAANASMLPPLQAADATFMAKDITRTKVSAALSIANIWAQGWGKKGSVKDAGGSGAGGGGRTFDFNLVGSTREDQLAGVTAGQLNEPVQAYVVSSQITNQQQLDNQIQTDATFGD